MINSKNCYLKTTKAMFDFIFGEPQIQFEE